MTKAVTDVGDSLEADWIVRIQLAASRELFRSIDFLQYRTGGSSMRSRATLTTLTLAVALPCAGVGTTGAQQIAASAAPAAAGPSVKDLAPDFTLGGADRYGLLKTPVRLSDYRGRTVVLAFFYQARTKG